MGVGNMNNYNVFKAVGFAKKNIYMHQPLTCLFLIRLFLQGAPLCEIQEGFCGDHEDVWNTRWK